MSALPAPPEPDAEVAPALRERLTALDYSNARTTALMEGTEWLTSPSDLAIVSRRLEDHTPFATAFRVFFLGLAVDAGAAERSLAPVSLAALVRNGLLVREGSKVRSRVQLAPVGSLLAASDQGDALRAPRDFVTGRTPSTMALLAHTVRDPVGRALDVGCGSGIQALAAARSADRVVATDVNPRALAFTGFNACLNGVANVDRREGSWFEPVDGERYDLIVSNPPFVISPESAVLYRDSGLPGDSASRELVAGAARHLADGGLAHLVCSWAHGADDWMGPVRDWTAGTGCDAWLLRLSSHDALRYATGWNAHLEDADPAAFQAALERWLEYYRHLEIETIGYGLVILRRRPSGATWFRAATLCRNPVGDPTAHIRRLFAGSDPLSDDALLDACPRPAPGQTIEQRRRAIVHVAPGIGVECEVDGRVVPALQALDGRRRVREVISEHGGDEAAILPAVRRMLELGMVTVP